MTTPTQDPIPSGSPENLRFNIEKIDEIVTSDQEKYIDRFGDAKYTIEGIRKNLAPLGKMYDNLASANAAIAAGQIPAGSFFFIRSISDNSIADEYQNVSGVATATSKDIPSGDAINNAVDELQNATAKVLSKIVTVGDPNSTGIVWGVQDSNTGEVPLALTKDHRMINDHFQEVEETANAAAKSVNVGDPGGTNIVWGVQDGVTGEVPLALDANQKVINPYIQSLDSRILNLEEGGEPQLSKIAIYLIMIYGQSNSVGSLGFSQTWRTPYPGFGSYPPGYTGEQDGSTLITTVQKGNNRTFNAPTPTTLIPLANNIVFGSQSEGVGHGMLDSIVNVYPELDMVTACHGTGGVPIQYLDKPTPAEIIAGNAGGVVIPQTSAEYIMLQAGQDMTHILEYSFSVIASPYYKGMYLIAKTVALTAAEGRRVVCDMAWLQGETNYQDSGYQDLVYALYDDYSADVELLTQQPEKMLMMIEQSNYSDFGEQTGGAGYTAWVNSGYAAAYEPGGASSAYTPESARVNTHFALNQRQNAIVDEALERSPARLIYNVSPRYPYTSNIHMYPHAIRAYGEQFGKVWRKLRIENQQWQPVEPVSWWFDSTSIFIQFNVPKGNLQFKWPDNPDIFGFVEKATAPYGIEHSAGALQKAKITLSGRNVIRITPDVAPVSGQTISYLKSSRRGAICDTDTTAGIFTDRAGTTNSLRNYCVPFTITL